MKIAIATMKVRAAQGEANFENIKEYIKEAQLQGADMIVFGQNVISGYLLGDAWLDDAFCRYVDSFNEAIIALSDDIAIVWGNIRYRNHRRFNAAFFAYQKQTHMRVKKNEQNEYHRDELYFENNDINAAISFKDMEIALNFGQELQLADLNINLDAHPFDLDEERTYHGNIIYANICGMQNINQQVKLYEGSSYIYYHQTLLYEAPYFAEDMQVIDLKQDKAAQNQIPSLQKALIMGIQEFDYSTLGARMPWIVGLSGGLDSSVTAALLCMALGSDRVYGYNLSTAYNSHVTMENAEQEAKALDMHYVKGSMSELLSAVNQQLTMTFAFDMEKQPTLVHENMQARMRGFILNAIAAIQGGVVVNNANMIEAALGYCTLYGDSIGALSPIGDISKERLIALAYEINAHAEREIIPVNLLPVIKDGTMLWETLPSAELKNGQTDPMKWYYHDALIERIRKGATKSDLLAEYRNGNLQTELGQWLSYYHISDEAAFLEDLNWVFKTMRRNLFKRIQLPPCITLHKDTLSGKLQAQFQMADADEATMDDILKIS